MGLNDTTESFVHSRWRGLNYDPCGRITMFLYHMGQGVGVRFSSNKFRLSEETVNQVLIAVAHRIICRLTNEYVSWPTVEEQGEISQATDLEKYMRYAIGSIVSLHNSNAFYFSISGVVERLSDTGQKTIFL